MKKVFVILFCTIFLVNCALTQNNTNSPNGKFKDERDNHIYTTVKIGEQVWMAENLAYQPTNGQCWTYDNEKKNFAKYSFLYDWQTAKTVCPSGWHLPSDKEWNLLEIAVGLPKEDVFNDDWRGNHAIALKVGGFSGFNLSWCGFRSLSGSFGTAETHAYYWSSSEFDVKYAWTRNFFINQVGVYRNWLDKNQGFSVRCVKN